MTLCLCIETAAARRCPACWVLLHANYASPQCHSLYGSINITVSFDQTSPSYENCFTDYTVVCSFLVLLPIIPTSLYHPPYQSFIFGFQSEPLILSFHHKVTAQDYPSWIQFEKLNHSCIMQLSKIAVPNLVPLRYLHVYHSSYK